MKISLTKSEAKEISNKIKECCMSGRIENEKNIVDWSLNLINYSKK